MQKFVKRKTSIVVEAIKLTEDTVDVIANWAKGQIVEEQHPLTGEVVEGININTTSGRKRLSQGMYVIKSTAGFHVSQPGAFEATYIPVEQKKPHPTSKDETSNRDSVHKMKTDPWDGITRFNEGPKP